ncbi:SHOCT domain-containing protein [Actinobacteria bacterium YIM 96077]|uniref:SHOCT domain-containing protein n=1 Tax=Phytoactinopolyspora halophila TaxID=1981511 RepID=A0A329QZA1_9ACTN|nr:SHOCT domain-containing protein [Phytoactinopolyspora halophila]AYY13214.1 SHOCT domain-containing protein [Actinobacteria bacterium YIM 96077]RAW17547.1 SHOCT domain-containing protein [Phytoactinopolyspora halophila]
MVLEWNGGSAMGDMGDMMNGMGAWMAVSAVFCVALLALVVYGAVAATRAFLQHRRSIGSGSRATSTESREPREILQRRYAAGEIDEDEYFRRISGLEQP